MFQARESFIADKFHEDSRGLTVFDWLDGTRPQAMLCVKEPDQTEQDFEQMKQAKVARYAFRTIACGVGRGAMFLSRMQAFPDLPLSIHPLTLSVKLQPSTLTACPDLTAFGPEVMHWPEFHNGVALAVELPDMEANFQVSRGWILQHHAAVEQAKSRRNAHESPELMVDRLGGFIFGLGLLKQLKPLRADDIYRLLRLGSDVVTVSTLLGLAISDHALATKICMMHMIPPDVDVEISGVVQAASMLGVGFARLGSNDRLTAELLLGQIGKRPIAGDRVLVNESETFSFAAGVGLGLVTLGRGEEMGSDLELKSRLIALVGTQDGYKFPPLAASQLHQRSLGDPATRSNLVLEGCKANVTLTAPGACMALGFGWWRTSDVGVLQALETPKTLTELENAPRPETLFFRRLAYWLVAWEKLSVSNWDAAMPEFSGTETDWLLVAQTKAYLKAAGALALGLKFAGTSDAEVKQRLWEHARRLTMEEEFFPATQYARTASKASADVAVDRHTFDTVRVIAGLAISMVCAGTGDLQLLRLLRALRLQTDEQTTYGTHQGLAQALGFLFLGGGRKSFDNQRIDKLACLLISVLPRFAASSNDQRFTLQAARHLFVLATRTSDADGDKENGGALLRQSGSPEAMQQLASFLVKNRLN